MAQIKFCKAHISNMCILYLTESFKSWNQSYIKNIEIYFSGRTKQSVTVVACCEKIAKLIPLSTCDTPNGTACPGEISHVGLFSITLETSSWNCKKQDITTLDRLYLTHQCSIFDNGYAMCHLTKR